ncbi:hypothetical protein DNTS_015778 [Danionella cerebrum]|uniref:Uncharacterized protein n=1 Tax=Danionella cerebrum TaxID=2873325 RepID=A0A553R0T1_9TELE|nr:hypothetical protein DNTS_015778 [Danionella translucida]
MRQRDTKKILIDDIKKEFNMYISFTDQHCPNRRIMKKLSAPTSGEHAKHHTFTAPSLSKVFEEFEKHHD